MYCHLMLTTNKSHYLIQGYNQAIYPIRLVYHLQIILVKLQFTQILKQAYHTRELNAKENKCLSKLYHVHLAMSNLVKWLQLWVQVAVVKHPYLMCYPNEIH